MPFENANYAACTCIGNPPELRFHALGQRRKLRCRDTIAFPHTFQLFHSDYSPLRNKTCKCWRVNPCHDCSAPASLERAGTMTEVKKEAFRKYLESSGTIDSITRVLVALYEEPDRPANASEFLKSGLGAPTMEDYEKVVGENRRLIVELDAAKEEVAELKAKLAEASTPSPDE